MESFAGSERAAKVEVSKHLAELWFRMLEVEVKANLLQVELSYAQNDQ